MITPIPKHLSGLHAQGAIEAETVAQFEIGDYKNFVYLILDWAKRIAGIIDPQSELSAPLNYLSQNKFKLESILLTHTHFDHVAGVPALLDSFSGINLITHSSDLHRLDPKMLRKANVQLVNEGDTLSIGSHRIKCIHTPGHSAGECCYFLDGGTPFLFTGDTLFIRDCGRTDLPTGSNLEMFHSLQKIKRLPKTTVILPGHHYQPECASTLERELEMSPPLRCASITELAELP